MRWAVKDNSMAFCLFWEKGRSGKGRCLYKWGKIICQLSFYDLCWFHRTKWNHQFWGHSFQAWGSNHSRLRGCREIELPSTTWDWLFQYINLMFGVLAIKSLPSFWWVDTVGWHWLIPRKWKTKQQHFKAAISTQNVSCSPALWRAEDSAPKLQTSLSWMFFFIRNPTQTPVNPSATRTQRCKGKTKVKKTYKQ